MDLIGLLKNPIVMVIGVIIVLFIMFKMNSGKH